jgi:hypothetical protein
MQKSLPDGPPRQQGLHATAQANHSATGPAPQRGWIGQAIGIFGLRSRLFPTNGAVAIGLPRLLPTIEGVASVWRRPDRQNCECPPAEWTSHAANPDAIVLLIMCLFSALSMTDEGLLTAKWTLAGQKMQRERGHPGSVLSFASGSAIKRIKAGVKACP